MGVTQAGPPVFTDALAGYLGALRAGDRAGAIGIATGLLAQGWPADVVLEELVANGQVEVGAGWQSGRWSIAMEHRASSIAEATIDAIVAVGEPAVPPGSRGRTLVTCTEGEWHTLPGRLTSEVMRLRGLEVTLLAPTLPATDLAEFLGADPLPVVAITCSMQLSLAGAWRTISALRAAGATILCGGRGFGPTGRWGASLGADLWAPTLATGADTMVRALEQPPRPPREPRGKPAAIRELRVVDRRFDALVEAAAQITFARWPYLTDHEDSIRAVRGDLAASLRALQSSVIVGDDAVLFSYVDWFESVLRSRHLPVTFVATSFQVLSEVLPVELPGVRRAAALGVAACSEDPMSS